MRVILLLTLSGPLAAQSFPTKSVRHWVLSFPIPLRSLFAVHPELLAPVLRIIQRVIATHVIKQAGIERRALGGPSRVPRITQKTGKVVDTSDRPDLADPSPSLAG